MKCCSRCGETKPLEAFAKNANGKYGRHSRCRVCHNGVIRAWYDENRDRKIESDRKYRIANPHRACAASKRYRERNAEATREYTRQWRRDNPVKAAAQWARRRAAKLQAVPLWADHLKITEVYALAQFMRDITGAEYHVDHVVPLRGRLVCGLHVHYNLQVLPGEDNLAKSNHFDEHPACAPST